MHSLHGADGIRRFVGRGISSPTARPADYASNDVIVDGTQQLCELLQYVGANTAVAHCIGQTEAAIAHATEIVAQWLTYLPAPCVRTMVNDGWHWSTQ
jgi:hypothetical protein